MPKNAKLLSNLPPKLYFLGVKHPVKAWKNSKKAARFDAKWVLSMETAKRSTVAWFFGHWHKLLGRFQNSKVTPSLQQRCFLNFFSLLTLFKTGWPKSQLKTHSYIQLPFDFKVMAWNISDLVWKNSQFSYAAEIGDSWADIRLKHSWLLFGRFDWILLLLRYFMM